MGLGKTVQTLGLLRVLRAAAKSAKTDRGPTLVICPTSLLNNWADEAARFTPELRTHISHDSDRHEGLQKLSDFDVIFTSYALIVRDLEAYKPVAFSAIVLDEASFIRNPDTATAKAVRQLRAGCRFALTGTPVENSVRDLWSIFEFLVPRQLPARDDFQERFVKPLSQPDSLHAKPTMERLRRLIRPNLLRRTKREVAKDLPEKIEKVLWCELSRQQREVYQRLLDEGREEIRQARRRAGKGSARMTMFTILLRLRQVCNDLRLVGIEGIDKLSPEEISGKWPVLEELLQETLEGGHKALIFSQFVTMLRLIKAKVDADGTPHSYLDGSTQDRAGEVAAFQTDPARRLFLISLKAGGYGLNLTAADEVVLVDPWWNPAVEAQAIDRAHRIGQGRPVTAYRLVTRGTVEEKILKLQAQKRAVMDMTLEEDGAVMAGVTDDELEAMLE
jgi:SNF2 family DNA or RNA helicase